MSKPVTAKVVGDVLGVADRTVLKWAREKRIPSIKASKRPVLFDLDAVLKAMESNADNSINKKESN